MFPTAPPPPVFPPQIRPPQIPFSMQKLLNRCFSLMTNSIISAFSEKAYAFILQAWTLLSASSVFSASPDALISGEFVL